MIEGPSSGRDMAAGVRVRSAGPSHVVQFYEREEFLSHAVARFVGDGLDRGERLVVFATPPNAAAFHRRLSDDGRDVRAAFKAGLLTLVDARTTLSRILVSGVPDRDRFNLVIGGALGWRTDEPVRAYGELVDLLWRDGAHEAALRLEQLWNELAARRPLRLLCAYAMSGFHGEADGAGFERICDAHAHVLPTESWGAAADPGTQLRRITWLQQRARALETEVRRRQTLEDSLRGALAEVRRSEEALHEADRRKDEFLAMLGHELRNPLSAISAGMQLLRLRGTADGVGDVIERQLRHLVRLVDDLLDVSRITRGKVRIEKEAVELGAVVAKAVELVMPLCAERSHALAVEMPAEGLLVEGDPVRLAQVFGNILRNAAKYTDAGGRITVTAWREGHEVVTSVADDGAGIAPEMLTRVFDLFVQEERAPDRSEGGLGIGLTLARSLVELHGGTIEARSAGLGTGSEFVVRFPAAIPGRASRRASERPASAAAPLRILLVDDNRDAAEVLGDVLRGFGHEVAVAHDGTSALAIASTFAPDAALLDIGLPGMDGHELAQRLRELLPARPPRLVALTGYGQEGDRERSRAAGFEAHLVKPVDLEAILAFLAAGIGPARPGVTSPGLAAGPERSASRWSTP